MENIDTIMDEIETSIPQDEILAGLASLPETNETSTINNNIQQTNQEVLMSESTNTTLPVITKTSIKKAKIAAKVEKKVAKITTPVTPVTPITPAPTATATPKVVKPAKPEIKVSEIKLGKEIIIKEMKSATTFFNASRKACLKGRNLELTMADVIKDDRVVVLTKEYITTHHLGAMRAILKNVADTKDLQNLLNLYFKS